MATSAHSPETDNVYEKAYSVSTNMYYKNITLSEKCVNVAEKTLAEYFIFLINIRTLKLTIY